MAATTSGTTKKFTTRAAASNRPARSERTSSAAGTCRNVTYSKVAGTGLIAYSSTGPSPGGDRRPPPLQWISVLYGRSAEIGALDEVIAQARHGCSGAVVLRGEAGTGKTALLDAATARGEAMRVLRTGGVESESDLAFAALHQLLWPPADRLPDPAASAPWRPARGGPAPTASPPAPAPPAPPRRPARRSRLPDASPPPSPGPRPASARYATAPAPRPADQAVPAADRPAWPATQGRRVRPACDTTARARSGAPR
ncbi:ATP-binding protein [Streptosporangium roseum]|uniref:ATP-binding protein n=1 Tax=Streptosporangium roseum TaxID=2001 RepID=UPI0033340499